MKTLVIVRHAKAEMIKKGQNDGERKLTKKGKEDAEKTAKILKENGVFPDLFISSHAKRAFRTARIFAERFKVLKKEIIKSEFLYTDFSLEELKEFLDANANDKSIVAVFGHNPTLQHLISQIIPEFNEEFSTSATVVVEFEVESWTEIQEKSGKLSLFLHKK